MAAIMGAGPVADAFVVAMRLPNHFRAIFAEGAFNAAFIPKYSRLLESKDKSAAQLFAEHILSLTFIVQLIVLALSLIFMSWIVFALTMGFPENPERFELAVSLSRITFPYLLFVTLVTVLSGMLNAHGRFAAAAAAPILLNFSLIAALLVTGFFPTAGHAAAWGFCIAGLLEFLLLWCTICRAGLRPKWRRPVLDKDMKDFFRTLGPAVIGSAGVQLAMFADTFIAALLPTGALSSIYYADRLYQLPVGVIGIAAGTVLLPEMSRKFASGDLSGSQTAQNRAAAITLALTAPFCVAFLVIPDLILSALFKHGAFNTQAALASSQVLFAYSIGLPAVVLIRIAVASFYARHDTRTPVIASLASVAVNVILKILLVKPFGASGLALATAIGAWINLVILIVLGVKWQLMKVDQLLSKTLYACLFSCIPLTFYAFFAPSTFAKIFETSQWQTEITFVLVGLSGALIYCVFLFINLVMFGIRINKGRMTLR